MSRYEDNTRRNGRRGKKKKGSAAGTFLYTLVLVISLAVFCFAAWKLIGYYLQYKAGSDEYSKLNDQFVTIDSAPVTPAEEEKKTALTRVEELEDPVTLPEKVEKAATQTVTENGEQKILPLLKNPINFNELQQINPEVIGWIRLGALGLSYPVTQAADNDYYLHRTFERLDNFAGCIFLNCDNSRYLTDQNSIIYGHNMKDGSMFGNLKDYKDQKVYDSNPYFWVFTPELIYQYRIFSCSIVSKIGDPYRIRFTTEDYASFIAAMQNGSEVDNHGLEVTTSDRIVTLSTCTGNDATRFIVQGVLEQMYIAS